jgi:ribosomal subunit interface protein
MTMQIDIQSRKFSLTRALRDHVERRLKFISGARYENIKRVMVRLSDINGPRGGNDKCCLIQVKLSGQPDVVIADTRSDLYTAINSAAARVSKAVARKLTRRQHKIRGRTATRDPMLFGNDQAEYSFN